MKKNLNQPQENELQYLQLLSKTFPTIADASTEIINLQAILNLPKGTEHFLADIHGAYESFQHGQGQTPASIVIFTGSLPVGFA